MKKHIERMNNLSLPVFLSARTVCIGRKGKIVEYTRIDISDVIIISIFDEDV